MADIKSPEERSANMSKIRNKDTKPEVWLRKKLFARGYRYRNNVSNVPGHPDIWLAKYNTAVFVHGCFWHRHDLECVKAQTDDDSIGFYRKCGFSEEKIVIEYPDGPAVRYNCVLHKQTTSSLSG